MDSLNTLVSGQLCCLVKAKKLELAWRLARYIYASYRVNLESITHGFDLRRFITNAHAIYNSMQASKFVTPVSFLLQVYI